MINLNVSGLLLPREQSYYSVDVSNKFFIFISFLLFVFNSVQFQFASSAWKCFVLTEFLLVLAFLINFVWKARMRKIRICNTIKTWNFLKAADSQSCIQRVENRQKLEQFYFSP